MKKVGLIALTVSVVAGTVYAQAPGGFDARTDENVRNQIMAKVDAMENDPYDLLQGVYLNKLKGMRKQLVFGQNVESKLGQLKTTAKQKTPVAKEAQEALDAIEAARVRISGRIDKALEIRPGLALTDITLYRKTWPTDGAKYADAQKKLQSSQEVLKLQQANLALKRFEDKPPQNPGQAKTYITQLNSAKAQMEALKDSSDAGVQNEAKLMIKKFNEKIGICERVTPAKKR